MTTRRKLTTYRIGPIRISFYPFSWWPKDKKQWGAVWALIVGLGGSVFSLASLVNADEGLRSVLPPWMLWFIGCVVTFGAIVQRFNQLRLAAMPPQPTVLQPEVPAPPEGGQG